MYCLLYYGTCISFRCYPSPGIWQTNVDVSLLFYSSCSPMIAIIILPNSVS